VNDKLGMNVWDVLDMDDEDASNTRSRHVLDMWSNDVLDMYLG
ncbi:hypothetical protein A2U01_0089892, partial [Trifolium medium]|nr:hypothetical protein [Trifolium medium]